MYIRFVTSRYDAQARCPIGFFRDAYSAARSPRVDTWIREALWRELDWFGINLAVPHDLIRKVGHHGFRNGVCWFRDSANAHVSRARYVCWLLEGLGCAITELRSHRPGTVIWSDTHQIVALVDKRHPVLL